MDTRARIPHLLILLGLVGLTMAALATSVRTAFSDEAGVKRSLPARVGSYTGADILYCHNREVHGITGKLFEGNLDTMHTCPDRACGEPLHTKDIGEAIALPASTDIYKKRYRHGEAFLTATVVLSGDDRSSFHRPKVCIGAQGHRIVSERIVSIPLDGRDPLDIKVYDLEVEVNGVPYRSFFAFWYVGKKRETASHYERMFWMGFDRMVHNVSYRWAYVSVTGVREEGNEKHIDRLTEFLTSLYPQVRLENE